MENLSVHVWSDVACPWCYVGKRHLELALSEFPEAKTVSVYWHAFELDPSAPKLRDSSQSYVERLAEKYGCGVAGAQKMIDRMVQVGRERGLTFDFARAQAGNTFSAHQLLHWAAGEPTVDESAPVFKVQGAQHALKERLLRAYFSEGEAIGDPEVLVRLAGSIGLSEEGAYDALHSNTLEQQVRTDEQRAHQLGISGVPFFLIGRYGVSGAQPPELLTQVLERAWADRDSEEIVARLADRDALLCTPTGCA